MTEYGPRVISRRVTLTNRTWNDVREELQHLLDDLTAQTDVTNILLSETRISEGGGTTTVELPGSGSGLGYFVMGA